MPTLRQTAQADRIAFAQKLAFGFGMATPIAFVNAVGQLTPLIYNIGLGVSPFMLGIAQMIPRLWDAVSDPVAGFVSDNTRSRWGRRRPYIVVGGLLSGLTFALIWMAPEGLTERSLLAFYIFMTLLFYTAVTIMSVPLVALGCEMSGDYHERTKLFAYGSFVGNVFAIVTPWMYRLAHMDIFDNEVSGMKAVGMVVAVIIVVSALIPGFICKEPKAVQVQEQRKVKFWPSIKTTFRNRTFLRVIGVVFLVTAGFSFVGSMANYITIYYLFDGKTKSASSLMAYNGSAWAIAGLITVFPMAWISKRIGKARTVQLFVMCMVVGCVSKVVCYNRDYPWLVLIPTVLISAGMLVLYTMAGALIADICDEDELEHGVRREGSYSAVNSWWLKFAGSTGFLVAGGLIELTGFDEKLGAQSESTLFWLRFWEIGVPAVFSLGAFFLLQNYPLTEYRVYEIKDALAKRHALEDAVDATDSSGSHTTDG